MGTPRPDWPTGVFTVSEAWGYLSGHSTLPGIAEDLRRTDVHPPLYFWMISIWRAVIGTSLFATRAFSVLCALGSLALVGAIAVRVGIPAYAAMLLMLGCYGFVYTGGIARGFALGQLLNLAAIYLLLRRRPFLAGLLFGAATLSNYLAVFTAVAALLWTLLAHRRAVFVRVAIGFAISLPVALWFFLPQRASRAGQFPAFDLLPALSRVAQYMAATIFGGLPLYAGGARPLISAALAALILILLAVSWRPLIARPLIAWPLLALCAAAPPAGLLALGSVFNNIPIELRYLAFATPFMALLLAAALAGRPRLYALVLVLQAASIVGLATRPETMQPQSAATLAAARYVGTAGLVLLPRGNDGVGIVGSVLVSAPADLRLYLVTATAEPAAIRATASRYPVIVLALLELDEHSRAAAAWMHAAFADQPCWREHATAPSLRVYENRCS